MASTQAPPSTGFGGTLDRYFHISERGSTVRIEIIAGLATLSDPGVYRVRPNGSRDDAGVLLAANVDPAEADPTRIAPAEIAAAVGAGSNAPTVAAASATRSASRSRTST